MANIFNLHTKYSPAGDQPQSIEKITNAILNGSKFNTLVGVTGSGKTFTMANIIKNLNMPTLVMSHNKTLCAQLYSEFKSFFPQNRVEYFISHFDYYMPEAYNPRKDLFTEKDSSINDELERLRLSAMTSILSCNDTIVVASVSANYGLGNPVEFLKATKLISVNDRYKQRDFITKLIEMGYVRNEISFDRGNFRVNGETIDIFPAYNEIEFVRVEFFDDIIESIKIMQYIDNVIVEKIQNYTLYATNPFVVEHDRLQIAAKNIEKELDERLKFFKDNNRIVEYERLKTRCEFDIEMLKENGIFKGIENYARHLTGRKEGETPYSFIDYYECKNIPYLIIVDESHMSLPQFNGMYKGDRSRKEVLVEYGFRLPSALDNRPLTFEEFISKKAIFLFVSATPGEYELKISKENIANQIIRPTGLVDPICQIRDSKNQVLDLLDEIKKRVAKNQRVLITTLTKKMSEELAKFYLQEGIKVQYLHSEKDAIERNHIIRSLRQGVYDVIIGVNLLREGLDLPEVSLVAILDADKEGFLRSQTSIIQTMGRAARNVESLVILYAQKITKSMQSALDIAHERRQKQIEFNKIHNITPKSVSRSLEDELRLESSKDDYRKSKKAKIPPNEKEKILKNLKNKMLEASKKLDFEEAIKIRDEIARIKSI